MWSAGEAGLCLSFQKLVCLTQFDQWACCWSRGLGKRWTLLWLLILHVDERVQQPVDSAKSVLQSRVQQVCVQSVWTLLYTKLCTPSLLLPCIGSSFHFLMLCFDWSAYTSSFLSADLRLTGSLKMLHFFKKCNIVTICPMFLPFVYIHLTSSISLIDQIFRFTVQRMHRLQHLSNEVGIPFACWL